MATEIPINDPSSNHRPMPYERNREMQYIIPNKIVNLATMASAAQGRDLLKVLIIMGPKIMLLVFMYCLAS